MATATATAASDPTALQWQPQGQAELGIVIELDEGPAPRTDQVRRQVSPLRLVDGSEEDRDEGREEHGLRWFSKDELDALYADINALFREKSEWVVCEFRHGVGGKVNAACASLRERAEESGANRREVEQELKALREKVTAKYGLADSSLYEWQRVAERLSLPRAKQAFEKCSESGRVVSWGHFVAISTYADGEKREDLLALMESGRLQTVRAILAHDREPAGQRNALRGGPDFDRDRVDQQIVEIWSQNREAAALAYALSKMADTLCKHLPGELADNGQTLRYAQQTKTKLEELLMSRSAPD